ncbi:unnamed protein product, partial [Meganyctiphanes norvegica]
MFVIHADSNYSIRCYRYFFNRVVRTVFHNHCDSSISTTRVVRLSITHTTLRYHCIIMLECKIHGASYYNGQHFLHNCMSYTCADGKFITTGKYKPQLCSECLLANDPHITTFEGVHYDYHEPNEHVVAEGHFNGKKSVVSSEFSPCTQHLASATCIETVYFKPNNMEHTNYKITILKTQWENTDTAKVEIDGYQQSITVSGNDMQVLKGGVGGQTEYPVLAYWISDPERGACLQFTPVDT